MSGVYVVKNGAEYFIPSPSGTPPSGDEVQGDDNILEGVSSLGNQLSEFLNCFILFGYDAKGRPVRLSRISSYMENTAINGLIADEMESQEIEKWASIEVSLNGEDDEEDDEDSI